MNAELCAIENNKPRIANSPLPSHFSPSGSSNSNRNYCSFFYMMMAMMSPLNGPLDRSNGLNDEETCNSTDDASATLMLAEATADYCQQLAQRLKRKDSVKGKHARAQKVPSNPIDTEKDALQPEERQKFQLTTEENIRLRAVIQDVTEANKRWQKYNQERQTYMQKMMDTMRDLKNQIREGNSSGSDLAIGPPDNTSEEFVLLQQNYEKVLEENRRLLRQLEDAKRKNTQLNTIVSKTKSDNGEHIELLQMQVRAHRDDWEAEREEKKNILKRETRLQEQLAEAKTKIKELQRELHRLDSCLCHTRNGVHTEPIIGSRHSSPAAYNIPPDSKLIPRSSGQRSQSHYQYQYGPFDDDLATDSSSPMLARKEAGTHNSSSNLPVQSRTRECLICPECATTFSAGNHQDFLEHFEICQKRATQ